jgi:formylglycine-generating enzyme
MKTAMIIRMFALCAFILFFAGKDKKAREEKLDLKKVEKSLAKVTDKLYACKYEATNLEYRIFLKDLKSNKQFDLYNQSIIDSMGWNERNVHYNVNGKNTDINPNAIYYHTHEAYNNYPIVNITHQGVENYCKWLTDKYNSYQKRKFKKVIFRLPTEKEWIRAAEDTLMTSYGICYPFCDWDQTIIYQQVSPKYIAYDRKKDKYSIDLNIDSLNLKVKGPWKSIGFTPFSETPSIEPVGRYNKYYKPNSLGIYNMLGNVAEMIQEKGRTKGGFWESTGYYLNPFGKDEFEGFTGSSKYIGFRYFMEVVEK